MSLKDKLSARGWLWIQGYTLTVFGVVVVVWMNDHAHDNGSAQSLGLGILGFLSAIIMAIYVASKANENKELLQGQNVVLSEIKNKTNGNVDRLLQEQRDRHNAELMALEAQAKADRHDRDGQVNAAKLKVEMLEGEIKTLNARLQSEIEKQAIVAKAEGK